MVSKVTLLGSSSGRNAGDAALIAGIMQATDDCLGRQITYDIPTINPYFVRKSYPNKVVPVSMLPWAFSLKMLGLPTWNSISKSDVSLIFDAVLFDRALFNPLFNYLSTLALLLPAAKRRGKKIGCYSVGVGPVNTPRGQRMLQQLCEQMDFITVRDEDSRRILKEIGVQNPRIVVTADAALNVIPCPMYRRVEILRAAGLDPEKEILALNVSAYIDTWYREGAAARKNSRSMGKERFISEYAAAVDRVYAALGVPILFVCTQHHDVGLSEAIMSRASCREAIRLVSNRTLSPYEIKGVLAHVALLFGMRLHAVILASSELTPVAALPHQPKVVHYLRTLGLEHLALSFDEFSIDSLTRTILNAWSQRHEIRAQLVQRMPAARARAASAARFIRAIDRGEDLDAVVAELNAPQVQAPETWKEAANVL